ncbi:hypothetical protein, partial [Sphingomonas sp. S-NIH.Pt15_0812]|uniref:hypothetical protein n=1 Tax=Sphingomonas sp. S-NIH.Pt15_0812 TaxID=1920129 RepID=UPI0019D267B7
PSSVMLAASGFGPAHMIPVVFATLGESQLAEIAQPNFRLGSKDGADDRPFGMFRSLALIGANGSYRGDQTFAGVNANGKVWWALAGRS